MATTTSDPAGGGRAAADAIRAGGSGDGAPDRVVVYLGASAPVHATHVRLVRALLDEGHDRVFVFLLCWSPDRAGVSAESGAAQLRTWCAAALPAADRARLTLEVVQADHEGATRMRAALGAAAAPGTVEVGTVRLARLVRIAPLGHSERQSCMRRRGVLLSEVQRPDRADPARLAPDLHARVPERDAAVPHG